MTQPDTDHRRFPRIPAEYTVLVRCVDPPAEGFARTSTVGRGGCGVLTREPVPACSAVELLITVGGEVIRVMGRTVYARPVEAGLTEIGVQFLDIAHEDLELLEGLLASRV